LKRLYGLKQGGDRSDDFKHSPEGLKFSEDEIAKEVGFSTDTLERADKIEKSDLPEQLKDAAFKGKIGINPLSEILNESKEIREKIVNEAIEQLKDNDHIYIEKITDDIKDEQSSSAEKSQNLNDFLTKYSEALEQIPNIDTTERDVQIITSIFRKALTEKNIKCPVCGNSVIKWGCGHDF